MLLEERLILLSLKEEITQMYLQTTSKYSKFEFFNHLLNFISYSPFYITDDPIGGYEYKTNEEREVNTVNANLFIHKIKILF